MPRIAAGSTYGFIPEVLTYLDSINGVWTEPGGGMLWSVFMFPRIFLQKQKTLDPVSRKLLLASLVIQIVF